MRMKSCWMLIWPLLAGSSELSEAQGASARASQRELGSVRFETSCPEARGELDDAVALLHHMMYEQAREQFSLVQRNAPQCAMAHWGIAMTLFHPLWPDSPTEKDLRQGLQAIEKALEIGPKTERERAYIEAVGSYYREWQSIDESVRLSRYRDAMAALAESYPEDEDAQALYALSLLATAPGEDASYAHQEKAARILEEIYAEIPDHPGAIHYGIHAYDFPPLAERGVHLADAYDKIAPDVPHALHMPSHIYVRLGRWEDTIDWNRRSAQAAREQPVHGAVSMHYVHAMDYAVYAYLQKIQDEKAERALKAVESHESYQPHFAVYYGIAAIHARIPLERKDWVQASSIDLSKSSTNVDWNAPTRAIGVYARGLGFARSGDAEGARRAHAELEELSAAVKRASETDPKLRFWAKRLEVQHDTVGAWLALVEGDQKSARQRMRRAADLEDAVGKGPVMPGFVLPARELLGDLLLELGESRQALAAYEASLESQPRRANSLYGAAKAADGLGDRAKARRYYRELVELASEADTRRPILVEAERFLERSPS